MIKTLFAKLIKCEDTSLTHKNLRGTDKGWNKKKKTTSDREEHE